MNQAGTQANSQTEQGADQQAGRRYSRGTYTCPVACFDEAHLSFATGLEISEGGLLISADADYKIGEILQVRFFIPGTASYEANCEVAYVVKSTNDRFAGLRFVETNEQLKASIREFVSRD
ncbi:MAG: PilZ domain-containing protein [Proteobacteria bacterium]|nr:MAG: PilZ domain-containing protein [Pseudomonadota bacterium]